MLEIKNLSVSIEDKLILDNLSLSVNAGEVAAIMGPNGSGKSTLAYVLAGKPAYKVISGEVLLDGERSAGARAEQSVPSRGCFWRSNIRSRFPVSLQ